MLEFLKQPGFLGSHAPLISDLSLVFILLSSLLFTIGVILVRRKHYEAHRWVQTTAAAINAICVLSVMVPSFFTHISPGLPGKFFTGDYAISTIHGLIGLFGLILGVFVVLRGHNLVPRAWRFKNYKAFMRTSYTLYMLATLLGIFVYLLPFVFGI